MGRSLINGTEQILAGTIPLSALVSGYSIPTANLAQGTLFIQSGGTVPMAATLNMGTNLISNLAPGVAATDAVNVGQLNALKAGTKLHFCQTLSNTNVAALTGLPTVDGVTMIAGGIVLLVAQTTASQNGPWAVAAGAWTRPTDWAAASVLSEGQYFILDPDGTTYKNTKWFCTNTGNITVDTTATVFIQDQSGTAYAASAPLLLTGTVFSVTVGNGIQNLTGTLAVKAADTSLTVAAAGVNVTPGTAAQFLVTNAGATAASMVSMSGDVTLAATGATTVTNTISTGFTKYTNFVVGEVVGGALNGANTAFTVANTPANAFGGASTMSLYLNGQLLQAGAGNDYTIAGTAITALFAPLATDKLTANYMR